MKKTIFLFLFLVVNISVLPQGKIDFVSNFENGNGKLVYQHKRHNNIAVRPELKNGDRLNVWFNFKIYNFRKDTILTIDLPFDNRYYAPDPLLIFDNKEWHRIKAEEHPFYKRYYFIPISDTIQIATGIPYTYSQLISFTKEIEKNKHASVHELTKSEGGLSIPLIKIDSPPSPKKGSLFFVARQHAFESPSSYFAEGLVRFFTGNSVEAAYLRDNYTIYLIPIMDVDQVYAGGTGKDQLPSDFNRNWIRSPHWNGIKAFIQFVDSINKEIPVSFFIDIHSPYPISAQSSHFYCVYKQDTLREQRLVSFFQSYSAKEGFKLQKVFNDRVKEGQRTLSRFMGNETCMQDSLPCFNSNLLSFTYEQSWQAKLNGEGYTIETIFKSAENMGLTIYETLTEKRMEK